MIRRWKDRRDSAEAQADEVIAGYTPEDDAELPELMTAAQQRARQVTRTIGLLETAAVIGPEDDTVIRASRVLRAGRDDPAGVQVLGMDPAGEGM